MSKCLYALAVNDVLQFVAGGCRVVQGVAVHCNVSKWTPSVAANDVLQYVWPIAVFCIVLQFVKLVALCVSEGCVAVCCRVLQGVAVWSSVFAVCQNDRCWWQ